MTVSTALTPIGQNRERIGELFNRIVPSIERVAPNILRPERLLEIMIFSLRTTPGLARCGQWSVLGALFQCAKLGLYPDQRGHVWLIPRRTGADRAWEAHFQLGYKGYRELAYRTGRTDLIEAREVHERDEFEYEYGTEKFLRHRPYRGPDSPGCLVASYAQAWLRGVVKPAFYVMEAWDVQRVKDKAVPDKTLKDPNSAWSKWEEEMWQKLPISRLCKQLPLSADVEKAVALDELTLAGKSQQLGEEMTAQIPDFRNGLPADEQNAPPDSQDTESEPKQ